MDNNEIRNENTEATDIPTPAATPETPVATPVYEEPAGGEDNLGKTFALISMLAGIFGTVTCSGVPFGIAALVFASIAKKRGCASGKTTLGTVLGIVSIVLFAILMVFSFILGIFMGMAENGDIPFAM